MTRNEARKLLAREALLMFEHDGTSTLDGDKTLEVIDKIFDEFGEQLQDKDDEIELLKHRVEEAMKPKTCLGCLHCNKAYQLTSFPPQYELNCGVFKTVFVNDFKQYCSRYEPKEIE